MGCAGAPQPEQAPPPAVELLVLGVAQDGDSVEVTTPRGVRYFEILSVGFGEVEAAQ